MYTCDIVYTKSIGSEQCSAVFVLPCSARGIRLFHKGSCLRPPPGHHQFCVWSNCCFRPVNVYLHSCTSRITAVRRPVRSSAKYIRADIYPFHPSRTPTRQPLPKNHPRHTGRRRLGTYRVARLRI